MRLEEVTRLSARVGVQAPLAPITNNQQELVVADVAEKRRAANAQPRLD
jgi:hypothetical protein